MLKKRTIFRIANLLLGITSEGLEIADCKFFAKTAASSPAAKSRGCSRDGLGLLLDALARDDRDANVLFGSRVTTKKKNEAPIAEPYSLPIDIGSLSAREIELSEDYTCVISHGPNPKTVHIFGDCVLESHCFSIRDNTILLDEKMEKKPTADGEMFPSE